MRRESTHFIKARAGWWLSEAQTWAVCRETAGEAQVKVNYGCEFPLQPIKPTEPSILKQAPLACLQNPSRPV